MSSQTLDTGDLRRLVGALAHRTPAADDAERIDRLRVLEELKAAIAAAQVEEITDFVASRRAHAADQGEPADRRDRGIAAQVGLALRCSPWQASRRVGLAVVLCHELPHTRRALQTGRITEWRATLVARETATLSLEHRRAVDAELAPAMESLGDRGIAAEARRIAYRLDPQSVVERSRAAAADRRISIRPAPDTMVRLTLLAPVAQGVAAYAALCRDADLRTAKGDARSRGQVMADTMVERLTGQARAEDVPVEVTVLMPVDTLLGESDDPAELLDHGPVPAAVARDLALADTPARRWLRRVYTSPDGRTLLSMDSARREFTAGQRTFFRLRDRTCRTPWCDAPVRHADHVQAHARGGRTAVTNGQGLCAACNHAKQARGWHARLHPDGTVRTRTPTGHGYSSRAPDASIRRRPGAVDMIFGRRLDERRRAA